VGDVSVDVAARVETAGVAIRAMPHDYRALVWPSIGGALGTA
jgi:hypothetical protein